MTRLNVAGKASPTFMSTVVTRAAAGLLPALLGLHVLGQTAIAQSDMQEMQFDHSLPLVISADNPVQQGFVRIINHSNKAGTVEIRAFDDFGESFGPVTLDLEAKGSAHFNSDDLESGNVEKSLSDGVGNGQGDWRLELATTLEIEPLAYVRTADGFVTSMHDLLVQGESMRYHVPIFNPASNLSQVSRLRLINPVNTDAEVVIEGLDDRGALPVTTVRFTLPARGSRTVSAQDLESGAGELAGRLGDGEGKWQLYVSADRPIQVMNLLASPTGHLTNLSTSTSRRGVGRPEFAPIDQSGFNEVVVGKLMYGNFLSRYTEFVSDRRFEESKGVYVYKGRYTYENNGPNAGRLELYYDAGGDRDRCTISLTFDSAVTGILVYTCDNGDTGTSTWRIEDVPEPDSAPDLVVASFTASDRSPEPGKRFTLTATVRNQGDRRSVGATLRYYRSANATVSTFDMEVATDLVESLAASGESEESARVQAPTSGGIYYFFACVEPVSSESDADNNCSSSVLVAVL